MGLIKAAMGAVGGVLGDQWKEFFYCESMPPEVLVTKGMKRTSSQGRSSNTSAEDNIISNGSVVAVNEGQCMIIVEQGKVVDMCNEPGEYVYDTSTEPSIFTGDLKDNVKAIFGQIGKRFTFGGDPGKDQRVYYFNMKEIYGNKFGTAQPIPVRLIDNNLGIDWEVGIRCFGEYSYKITNPLLFYTNVCSNITDEYRRDQIDSQMKSELMMSLGVAIGTLTENGMRYSALPRHGKEIANALNEDLSDQWRDRRGVEVYSFALASVTMSEEDAQRLKDIQMLSNPNRAAAAMAGATADAMRIAAGNEGGMGAMGGFVGMNMAGMAGGANVAGLFAQGQQQQMYAQQNPYGQQPPYGQPPYPQQPQPPTPPPAAPAAPAAAAPAADAWTCSCGTTNTGKFCANCGGKKPEPKPAEGSWTCSCGTTNTGKFCANCGGKKPEDKPAEDGWTCSCGAVNKGKFCAECGSKKPEGAPLFKCDKCGWEPPDPHHPPKFCPECGDIFDDNDKQ